MSSDDEWEDVWGDEDDAPEDEDVDWDGVWDEGEEPPAPEGDPSEFDGTDGQDPTSDDAPEPMPAVDDDPDGDDSTGPGDTTAPDAGPSGTAASGAPSDGEMFEESFAAALDDAPSIPDDGGPGMDDADMGMGGEFGMGDEGGMGGQEFGMGGGLGGDSDFEEEEFESDLSRIDIGIEGLDEMIQGGVPERTLMVAIGSAGTGKTTFGLQFLNHALENGERAIYITLEENKERITNSATEKGMAYDEYVDNGDLAIVDFDPIEMANSLSSIRSELPELVQEFGASRLVLDSVSLLEMMYDDRARRRNEIYDFTESLKRAGVTTMLTSEASQSDPFASRHGIVEYLTDAVFVLRYVRPDDFRETRLAVEIQKIRDANHSRETKPYEITNEGINVYRQANIF